MILAVLVWRTESFGLSQLPPLVHPEYVAASAVAVGLTVPLAALKTRALLRAVDFSAGLRLLVEVELIYRFFVHVLPLKLGVPAKAVVLERRCGLALDRGLSLAAFDYLLDAVAPLGISLLGASLLFRGEGAFSTRPTLIAAIALAALVAAFLAFPTAPLNRLARFWEGRGVLGRKVVVPLLRFSLTAREMWRTMAAHRQMSAVVAVMLGVAGLMALSVGLLFMSAGVHVPFLWVFVVSHVGLVAGGASMVPLGGLGVREATMHLLFVALGVEPGVSLYAVLVSRAFLLVPAGVGYLLAMNRGMQWLDRNLLKTARTKNNR